jgi:hypothetical protein
MRVGDDEIDDFADLASPPQFPRRAKPKKGVRFSELSGGSDDDDRQAHDSPKVPLFTHIAREMSDRRNTLTYSPRSLAVGRSIDQTGGQG